MVIQKVKIIRLTTEDGQHSLKEGSQVGIEGWVIPSRIAVKRDRNVHRWFVSLYEKPTEGIPVELLEFTNEFKIVPDVT